MDDGHARQALQRFGVDPGLLETPPLARRRKRAVWRAGTWALKWFASRPQAEKVLAVSRYLHARGAALPLPAEPGLVDVDGDLFLLFPWVDGRLPEYHEPGMLEAITGALAQFHRASAGYLESGGPMDRWMGDWTQLWADRRHQLHKLAERASLGTDAVSLTLQRELPGLRDRIRWCQKRLPAVAPASLLGHGDFSRQNLILTPDGSLVVIDLDQVNVSLPVRDLSRLVSWVDHDLQNWSTERFGRILSAYGSITPADLDLLLLDQAMPHLAIDIAVEYYSGARPHHPEELERCLATDREKLKCLGLGP